MSEPPSTHALDETAALLREGYRFLPVRHRRLGDVFRTRLMGGRPVVCVQGEDAARMFYTPDRFTRRGALPPTALLSLQDRGSVQTLDGDAHRRRKALFLALSTPEHVRRMTTLFEAEWRRRATAWAGMERVVLLEEVRSVLTRAACRWAGARLTGAEAARRAAEFGAMIDGAGAVGLRNWRGLALRSRTERWARGLIEGVRSGDFRPGADSPLHAVAAFEDEPGRLLPVRIAAVELLNLLRPTVAVERFIVFAALALHRRPDWRERLRSGSDAEAEAFAQEVRRVSPFFPAVAGRALEAFEWGGRRFQPGDWVMLDIIGTNHDERSWSASGAFRPERFLAGEGNAYNFIPQGGGDMAAGHRCPGEPVTVALIARAARLLSAMTFETPEQDLRVDLGRMPTGPASGFVMRNVRLA